MLKAFRIVVLSGDQEFVALSELTGKLPSAPRLNWATASQHCALIKRSIRFLREKIRSLRHRLPFDWVPGIMVVRMVLHIIEWIPTPWWC